LAASEGIRADYCEFTGPARVSLSTEALHPAWSAPTAWPEPVQWAWVS